MKKCEWCHQNEIEDRYCQCDECVASKTNGPMFIHDPLSNKGRSEDARQLKEMYKSATNETERTAIKKSLYNINHEDKRKRSMREALIKATREHDHPNIKGIHEEVHSKSWYKNE